jgi:HAD superfamily hydrolase (TIGR01509 family)
MIKALFWDNDGVLVDTERLYFEANRQILARVGIQLTDATFVELFLKQGRGAWHLVAEKGFDTAEIQRLRERRNELYAELLMRDAQVIDGAVDVLSKLHGAYLMGIVTSSRRDHFELIHRTSGILRHIDFVLADGDYPRHKPEPDPYLAAVRRSGFKPEECIAIEDSERGLMAAKGAGIRCMVIPTGLTRMSDFSKADKVLRSIKDVPYQLDDD